MILKVAVAFAVVGTVMRDIVPMVAFESEAVVVAGSVGVNEVVVGVIRCIFVAVKVFVALWKVVGGSVVLVVFVAGHV